MNFDGIGDVLCSLPRLDEDSANALMHQQLSSLSRERALLSEGENVAAQTEFRRRFLPEIRGSSLCEYALEKPRGYPGDFVTQEMIWLARTEGGTLRYAGNTPAGELLNSLCMDMENAVANEERVHFLRSLIRTSPGGRVASIGCGSCIELWDPTVLQGRSDWDFVLVDQDCGALAAVRKHEVSRQVPLELVCDSVLRYILRADQRLGQRDLIYLFGLLDYFPEASARKIVARLWPAVAPGGWLVVTNAHPANPTRLWMEYAMDWHLTYKTAPCLLGLAQGLSQCRAEIIRDRAGVYQYLRLTRIPNSCV